MGYAIVGYFDQNSDDKIKELWKKMADIEVDDYLINSENSPHIKFAMFDSINLPIVRNEVYLLSKKIEKINIHFKKYGFYPGENPFLTIDIADSSEILKLHTDIQNVTNPLGDKDDRNYFDAGIWKPDCQLTVAFDKNKLAKAVNFLTETSMPFDGRLESLGLIEFHPAKKLFTYPLA